MLDITIRMYDGGSRAGAFSFFRSPNHFKATAKRKGPVSELARAGPWESYLFLLFLIMGMLIFYALLAEKSFSGTLYVM